MPESQIVKALFSVGLTREEFIDKFVQMQSKKSDGDDVMSIFDDNIKAETICAIFDEVDKNHDKTIDENELYGQDGLQNYDTSDGQDNLTDADIKKLYDKTTKNLSERYGTTDPAQLYQKAVQSGDYTPAAFHKALTVQIDILSDLIACRENDSEEKIRSLETKINNLIEGSAKVSTETKEEERKTYRELKENEQKLRAANRRIEEIKNQQNQASISSNYLNKRKEQGYQINEDELNTYNDSNQSLSSEIASLTANIAQYQNKINELNSKMAEIRNKAISEDKSLNRTIRSLVQELEREKQSAAQDISSYKIQSESLTSAQNYSFSMASAEPSYTEAYDEDTSKYCQGADELKQMWQNKWTKELGAGKAEAKIQQLGGQAFFNKVFEISQRLHCDANALMGVMNSESGVNPNIGNAAGGSAVGLIQFMPSTAKALGTTSQALKGMNAIEQLNFVEKMINYSKKVGGISADQNIDSATLYTLVFLPAYAKRDVLTSKGNKFYEHNTGLDLNKDGVISKADMAARVRKFMA